MKILLADDHTIVRQGLRSLLENKLQATIVAEASDGREAVSLAEKLEPDLVIMDIAMPGLNGLDALVQIKQLEKEIKVVILSMHIEDDYVIRALRGGAAGFVYKGSAFEDLSLALKAVAKGEIFLSPAVSQVLVNGFVKNGLENNNANKYINELSSREREIMQLYAEGKSRSEIANLLSISVKTVDRHKENIKSKMQLKSDSDIASVAKECGLTSY